MLVSSKPLPGTTELARFPDSDGRPMGDTDVHTQALIWLREALEDHLPTLGVRWYVAMNLILYWDRNNPRRHRDPDVLVARVPNYQRRSYRVWEERRVPRVLFEVVSRKTYRVDTGVKMTDYAQVGVPEYFLFDPDGQYLTAPLLGYRLRKGVYVPIKPTPGGLVSKQLGLRLVAEGQMLRLIDLRTGQPVLTRGEQIERRDEEALELRRRIAELTAEIEHLRGRNGAK